MRSLLLPALLLSLLVLSGCGQSPSACPNKPVASSDATGPSCCVVIPETPTVSTNRPGSAPAEPQATVPKTGDGEESNAFRFPEDAGGALLLKILQPKVTVSALAERTVEPHRKNGPAKVEYPTGLLPATLDEVPRLPVLGRRENLTPRLNLRESFGGAAAIPAVPAAVVLPEGKKVKAERLDPAIAPDLPLLGQPVPDRASLDDPTRTFSLEAVIAAPIPERDTPAPFVPQTVLDPFANRKTVQVTTPLEESSQPVSATPQVPKK